jgi:glucosamine--fructose-6-phosphate aminotransferase (isomerizing)
MCGIVAYTGFKQASPILLEGLKALEYRSYDSLGMYIPDSGIFRTVGNVKDLQEILPSELPATSGIAHVCWATHGKPSLKNTHPHASQDGSILIVHNGMIDNYLELRKALESEGDTFTSETDTEVLAHSIEKEFKKTHSLPEAVVNALSKVQGTYGIAVMHVDDPKTVITASMGSPIVIGANTGEHFIASDTTSLLSYTNKFVHLRDGEYAIVTPNLYTIYSFNHQHLRRKTKDVDPDEKEKKVSKHPHYMMREILDIPMVLENGAQGRIIMNDGNARLGGLEKHSDALKDITRIIIVGCGSSYFAGIFGKLIIEDYAGICVETEFGSEFRNRPTLIPHEKTAFLTISQSGETPGTIASLRKAKRMGFLTMSIVNEVESTIAKESDMGVYNHAGTEMGITSTKSFVSQLEILALLALFFGRLRDLPQAQGAELAMELLRLPQKVRVILSKREKIKRLAEKYLGYDDFLFVGREYNIPTAYEGALKLKKVSYVHAEGYPAGEMKHGPIAMINEVFPTFAIMPSDSVYDMMKNDVKEIRERNGGIIAIATEGNKDILTIADDVMYIPDTKSCLTPILASIPLQLFAYYTGALRGFNVDYPLDRTRDSLYG